MKVPRYDPSNPTPKQYAFVKKMWLLLMIISAAVLIFFAGAILLSGYKPNWSNYVNIVMALWYLIYFFFNKPTPPKNEQATRETFETK